MNHRIERVRWLVLLAGLLASSRGSPSEQGRNRKVRIESADRRVYVLFTPAKPHGTAGKGVGYSSDGRILWTLPFYVHDGVVLANGRGFIHVGPVDEDYPRNAQGEAIVFFRDGKLVKSHRVEDLASNVAKIRHVAGGGLRVDRPRARKNDPRALTLSGDEERCTLRMSDGTVGVFDTATGALVQRTQASR
jgi:hypothetical protein